MSFRLATVCVLGFTWACGSSNAPAAELNDFIEFSGALPGRMYIPPEAADLENPRPLVLYLHGGTVAGTDNVKHIHPAMDALVNVAKDRGAFLFAPQSPYDWNTGGWQSATEVMTMIDQAIAQENIDPNRLYVTGLSMGGGGTWDMLNHIDDRFAAALPIATDIIRPDLDATNFLDTPTWAFHARDDGIASVSGIRRIVNNIRAALQEPALIFPARSETTFEYESETIPLKYTEWPHGEGDQNHWIWPTVWSTTEVMDWMFSQSLGQVVGEFNGDGVLDVDDLDALTAAIHEGSTEKKFDVDGNGLIEPADREHWVTNIKQTWFGDANLDGFFDSGDMVAVFQADKYESTTEASWSEGDWTGDQLFDSGDLVAAFTDGGYEMGPRSAIIAVPEPTSSFLMLAGLIGISLYKRNIRRSRFSLSSDFAHPVRSRFLHKSK